MIFCKVPYRVSFFGGGSDYPEWYRDNKGEIVCTSIDKYQYISVKNLENFFNHNVRIFYSKKEFCKSTKEINHPVINKIFQKFDIKSNIELHYDGDLPSRSGLGSSSSFVVGLIKILNFYKYKTLVETKKLALEAIDFEHKILSEKVGIQDQIIASYGGFLNIKIQPGGKFSVSNLNYGSSFFTNLNKNLILVFIKPKFKRFASDIASKYVKKLNKNCKQQIMELLEHAKEAKKLIKSNKPDDFGKLLNETWAVKSKISKYISNDNVNDVYKLGIKSGALGGKLLGAGGGGFFLFYVPLEKKNFFKKNFSNFICVDFKFSNEGATIINL